MNDKKIEQDNIEEPSTNLQDYEIEISDKKSFLSNILNKFKNNRNQKLLNSSNPQKPQTTSRSISSLWEIGKLRASLFETFDNIRKSISERFSSSTSLNTFNPQIVSEDGIDKKENIYNNDTINIEQKIIIPQVKTQTAKNIIKNAKTAEDIRIEIIKINTSAIDEKKIERKLDNIENSIKSKNESSPSEIAPTKHDSEHDTFDSR